MMEKVFVYTGTATQPNITITRQEHEQLRSAWELVREIAQSIPKSADTCPYCQCDFNYQYHDDDCIWLQARQLVKGE